MSPHLERAAPPYVQIAEHFRLAITNGVVQPGTQLPPLQQIARDWGVATATAAKAITQLRAEGFVTSSSQGTFATVARKHTPGYNRLQMLRATGNGYRPNERAEILSATLAPAPDDVATALGLTAGDPTIRRQRRYLDDTGVIALSTSWLSGDLAVQVPELLTTEPLPTMTFGLVEERTGRRAVRRRDVISVCLAPADTATLLGIEGGTATLTLSTTYWDQHGAATEHNVESLGSGRELSAEYTLD